MKRRTTFVEFLIAVLSIALVLQGAHVHVDAHFQEEKPIEEPSQKYPGGTRITYPTKTGETSIQQVDEVKRTDKGTVLLERRKTWQTGKNKIVQIQEYGKEGYPLQKETFQESDGQRPVKEDV